MTLIDLHLLKTVIYFVVELLAPFMMSVTRTLLYGTGKIVGPMWIVLSTILHGSTDNFQNSPLMT